MQDTLYPLEFVVAGTPRSLGASTRSRERWKQTVGEAARDRIRETDGLGFLDRRPLSLTIYYFAAAAMAGDVDNIVKPVLDALIAIAYLDDGQLERVTVQKFEPDVALSIADLSDRLSAALETVPPVVYVRVDDDLSWRRLP